MNILVLAEDYPSENNIYALAFIHSRNKEYVKQGHKVDVISFKSKLNYVFEDVNVWTEKNYKNFDEVDVIVSHAPNLKNHLRFLMLKIYKTIPIVFVFHGHEIMNTSEHYPKAYWFDKNLGIKKVIHKIYDPIKLKILKYYLLKKLSNKNVSFIFVSEWMKNIAYESLSLNSIEKKKFDEHSYIVHNGVNSTFIEKDYKLNEKKDADFITIRPFDNPKYGVDVVYNIAKHNPDYTFHIYGKGDFFNHHERLKNIKIFKSYISQKDIPTYLNKYRYALMPTRLDAQGVMMCEIATYGMPIITSDIDICKEMLKEFSNASFIKNELEPIEIDKYIPKINNEKILKFDIKNLAKKELNTFGELIK